MEKRKSLEFTLNGQPVSVRVDPSWTLLRILREELQQTGTKDGCKSGDCGACTVLLDGKPVNACLLPALKVQNCRVDTIEGLGRPGDLHPIQKAFIDHGAMQCGYCTPGMILSLKALVDQYPNPGENQIRESISGNLCRCGNYIQIIEAIQSLPKRR